MGVDKVTHHQCVKGRKENRLQDGAWTEPGEPSQKRSEELEVEGWRRESSSICHVVHRQGRCEIVFGGSRCCNMSKAPQARLCDEAEGRSLGEPSSGGNRK